jgi:hypothetical protein
MSLCLINHHEDVLGKWMNSTTHSCPGHQMQVSGQSQSADSFLLRNGLRTNWITAWVGTRAGLDSVRREKYLSL